MNQGRIVIIDALRVLCVCLLITYHSFAIFTGSWERPESVSIIDCYRWIGRIAYSFMLPLWVFISGFLWGYQLYGKCKRLTFIGLVRKKTAKLLVPAYLFSLLYLLAFGSVSDLTQPFNLLIFLSGEGHLWFLPMLFWVFIYSYFVISINVPDYIKFPIVLVISALAWNLPSLGLGSGLYYLQFFYIGILTFKYQYIINTYLTKWNTIVFLGIGYIVSFVLLNPYIEWTSALDVSTIKGRSLSQLLLHIIPIPYQITGVYLFYGLALKFESYYRNNPIIGFIASYSFGIYIVHQFILMLIYYHTPLPEKVSSYLLPVLSFIITTVISIIFVNICLRSKIGRKLLS